MRSCISNGTTVASSSVLLKSNSFYCHHISLSNQPQEQVNEIGEELDSLRVDAQSALQQLLKGLGVSNYKQISSEVRILSWFLRVTVISRVTFLDSFKFGLFWNVMLLWPSSNIISIYK